MNLDYIAGLTDGEGCFSLSKHRLDGIDKFDIHPYCSIALVEKDLLVEVQKFLGFGFVRTKKSTRVNQRDSHEWVCRSQFECLRFCELLIPYLKLKKLRAIYLANFLKSRLSRVLVKHTKPYLQSELDCFNNLKQLNKRGTK